MSVNEYIEIDANELKQFIEEPSFERRFSSATSFCRAAATI